MTQTLVLALISYVGCFALTPLVRRWSRRHRLLDWPDAQRKRHAAPIPRTGGVAIFSACLVALIVLLYWPSTQPMDVDIPLVAGVLPAALIVFIVGLIDDIRGLK